MRFSLLLGGGEIGMYSELPMQSSDVNNNARMQKSDEGRTVSYWEATEDLISGSDGSVLPSETDVCIVGGGIAGITTAYLLAKAGRSVMVIDDGLIGGGETCRTTAHLSNAIDDRIYR